MFRNYQDSDSDEEQDEGPWCGGIDLDHLCMAPGSSSNKPMLLEDGVVAHHTVANVPYSRTNSGLQQLKRDICNSMYPNSSTTTSSKEKKKTTTTNDDVENQNVASGGDNNNDNNMAEKNMEEGNGTGDQQQHLQEQDGKELKGGEEDTSTVATGSSDNNEINLNDRSSNGVIQARVVTISGCKDDQTSADVSNVSAFTLPDPNGKSGGACTSALLKVLYGPGKGKAKTGLSFIDVLKRMRNILKQGRYTQLPQLTSSMPLSNSKMFSLLPPPDGSGGGVNRAVLIGINYTGQKGQLRGCHNDCMNMKDYIENVCGVSPENITILMDDGNHPPPTRDNILWAYQRVAALSKSGDAVFCHYSGHGGRLRDDDNGEEEDGYDETLVPLDYASAGQIRDDDLYTNLVSAMPKGSTLVALMDCCHSATVLDLPYKYRADGTGSGFQATPNSQLSESGTPGTYLCAFMFCIAIIFMVVFFPLMYAE